MPISSSLVPMPYHYRPDFPYSQIQMGGEVIPLMLDSSYVSSSNGPYKYISLQSGDNGGLLVEIADLELSATIGNMKVAQDWSNVSRSLRTDVNGNIYVLFSGSIPGTFITASLINGAQVTASVSKVNDYVSASLYGVTTSSFASSSSDNNRRPVYVDKYGMQHIINENADSLPSNYSSPIDFSASFQSANMIGISGSSFTVNDTNCIVSYVQWYSSGSIVKQITNGQSGYTLSAGGNNYITCSHPIETSWFANTDLWYRVGIRYQEKAYSPADDTYRMAEVNPISMQYVNEIWVSSSNVAAGINNYPSIGGVNTGGYKSALIHFYVSSSGNFTLTVSGSNEVNTSNPAWSWANITPSALNLCTNTTSGSYDSGAGILSGTLQYKDLNMDRIRVDLSGSSSTNFYMIAVRRMY